MKKQKTFTVTTSMLPEGFMQTPPRRPWGINFGGGLNSTALIIECYRRSLMPDWILFADTGSERPETLEHVKFMQKWCIERGLPEIVTVKWKRVRGDVLGFEPLHENCLRTNHLPSKAYGNAGCTDKWKVQPMDRWRKKNGYSKGAFAVGYDLDEKRRIKKACERGDVPGFTAWYPLIAWGIDRTGCQKIVDSENITVGKSSCFMCPNMKKPEWDDLKEKHPNLFAIAKEIEINAANHGNYGRGGNGLGIDDDRCAHGGCFT